MQQKVQATAATTVTQSEVLRHALGLGHFSSSICQAPSYVNDLEVTLIFLSLLPPLCGRCEDLVLRESAVQLQLLLTCIHTEDCPSPESIMEPEESGVAQKYLEVGVPVSLEDSLVRTRRQPHTGLRDLPFTTANSPA